ncbi:helix-turn-helix domain-containing protein [Arthrobacter sp. NPDC090010]|uniref:helix-turn-helix domain-containing protein n=1 Tax=Arthrobacter sp. NPDC090010 TaxID=3363942 RepID=UPI003812F36C
MEFRERIGENVKKLRADRGLTGEQLARRMRILGFTWTPSRVSELERGAKPVSLAEMIGLANCLSNRERGVRLVDLVIGPEDLRLNGETHVEQTALEDFLRGEPMTTDLSIFPEIKAKVQEGILSFADKYKSSLAEYTKFGGPDDFELWDEVASSAGVAEDKAARSLGITSSELLGAAAALWGRSLTAEREARSQNGMTAQARGRITRQLLDELRTHIGNCRGVD